MWLTNRQYGFRLKHSWVTALLDVVEELGLKMDQNFGSFLTLIDRSKAFHTISQDILCHKLKNTFKFSTSAVKLLRTYPYKTSQTVHHGDVNKFNSPVRRGVPQGSISGPLLHIIYSNDLPSCITHRRIKIYVNDVQLYIRCFKTDIDNCILKLHQDLDKWSLLKRE